jgi:hypothetical protein
MKSRFQLKIYLVAVSVAHHSSADQRTGWNIKMVENGTIVGKKTKNHLNVTDRSFYFFLLLFLHFLYTSHVCSFSVILTDV